MTSTTKANDAGQAYQTHQNDIARLIDVLQMELEAHAQMPAGHIRGWGDVGELGGIRSSLIDTVSAISGASREELEAFLNDAI